MEHFISVIGAFEDQIFQKRARLLERQKQRRERDKAHQGQGRPGGAGQAATKWKAQQPSAAFNTALQPVGPNTSGITLHCVITVITGSCVTSQATCCRAACGTPSVRYDITISKATNSWLCNRLISSEPGWSTAEQAACKGMCEPSAAFDIALQLVKPHQPFPCHSPCYRIAISSLQPGSARFAGIACSETAQWDW